jgi:hypothetical protein
MSRWPVVRSARQALDHEVFGRPRLLPLVDVRSASQAAASSQKATRVFTQHSDKPTLRLLINHDDGDREFDYRPGTEHALDRARTAGWTS